MTREEAFKIGAGALIAVGVPFASWLLVFLLTTPH